MNVTRFLSRSGIRVYQMPVETFPGHVNNIYLILDGDLVTLFDVGSGTPDSIEGLQARMAEVRERFGESARLEAVVHELDARVLNNFEERIVLASKDMRVFLERSGVKPAVRAALEEMYRFSKSFFKSVEIDRVLRDRDTIINGYRVHHTPGHCPGQICLEVDDLLFTADHVLSRITPHQSPAAITAFCGLEMYLQSLDKVRALAGVSMSLPGHEAPIPDLTARIDGIVAHHDKRLNQVLEICGEAMSLAEVSKHLFGRKDGYTRLLALEEAGAHVEYLFQRGELRIANLEDVTREDNPVIRYEARRGAAA